MFVPVTMLVETALRVQAAEQYIFQPPLKQGRHLHVAILPFIERCLCCTRGALLYESSLMIMFEYQHKKPLWE